MIAAIALSQYFSAAVVAAAITTGGILVNTWTQRRQRAIDAAQKEQDKGQDNSDYWEGQTQAMRKELTLLKSELASIKDRYEGELQTLRSENERQAREIVLLKTQVYDLQNDRQRQTSEGARQTREGDRQTREGERQTLEGKRLDKMRNGIDDERNQE